MLLQVPKVLDADQVAHCRRLLDEADWADGKITAGYQSAQAKHNLQLPEDAPAARELGELVLAALQRSPLFLSAALPLKVFPPLFNRYAGGHAFGSHVDNALPAAPGAGCSPGTGPCRQPAVSPNGCRRCPRPPARRRRIRPARSGTASPTGPCGSGAGCRAAGKI